MTLVFFARILRFSWLGHHSRFALPWVGCARRASLWSSLALSPATVGLSWGVSSLDPWPNGQVPVLSVMIAFPEGGKSRFESFKSIIFRELRRVEDMNDFHDLLRA